MFSGAACAPGHSRKTAATAGAQERRNRGVLKGRCIIRSIDALKEEVDATKACGYRARRGLDKNQLIPQRSQSTVPSGVVGRTELVSRSSPRKCYLLRSGLHCCQNLLKEMLCALHPIPGAGFVLQCKDAGVIVVEHDAHIPLNVGLAKAIPELGVNCSVRVGS